jgi:serine protease Do
MMASFETIDHFGDGPPPRPTTPPVRRGFIIALLLLCFAATLVYGIPYMAERTGYAWEAGRSRAATEALMRLDKKGVIEGSSMLFRMATTAASPAVVNIRNWQAAQLRPGMMPPPGGAGRFDRGLLPVSAGSGVIIDKAHGYIVTNNHVIKDADEVVVRLGRGAEWTARIVGTDPKTDLAVLQVKATLDTEARWGNSDELDIGDWVLAIGSPFELDRTVTAGIVSATGRNNLRIIGEGGYEDFIQTDAAVNPGNSGGPLIDLRGQVVGINTAIYSPAGNHSGNTEGGNVGIGFAISSNLAKRVVDELIKNGRVTRGYLGVVLGDKNIRGGADADQPGALVVEVDPDGPAAKAGVQANDVILKLGDHEIADQAALRLRTASTPIGSDVPLLIKRDGKNQTLTVKVGELPILLSLGIHVRDLSGDDARALPGSPDQAALIDRVIPGTPAYQARIQPGMRLLGIGRKAVSTRAQAEAALSALKPGAGVRLEVIDPSGQVYALVLGGANRNER